MSNLQKIMYAIADYGYFFSMHSEECIVFPVLKFVECKKEFSSSALNIRSIIEKEISEGHYTKEEGEIAISLLSDETFLRHWKADVQGKAYFDMKGYLDSIQQGY
jgi:hypothetical protein